MILFKIIRYYFNAPSGYRRKVIKTNMTHEQAKAHCNNPNHNSKTVISAVARRITKRNGWPWFDNLEEM